MQTPDCLGFVVSGQQKNQLICDMTTQFCGFLAQISLVLPQNLMGFAAHACLSGGNLNE